ncbi:hypothetical protein Hanom_Chr10g00927811 [Helianthus anomalus]
MRRALIGKEVKRERHNLRRKLRLLKKIWILNVLNRLKLPAAFPRLKISWRTLRLCGQRRRVAESVINSKELDKTVAHLLVAAQNDGYAQGYAECSYHVVNTLKVDWDTSKSATHGVDTETALVAANTRFNTLLLLVMDLINAALHSEGFMTRLREAFPDREEGEDEDLA